MTFSIDQNVSRVPVNMRATTSPPHIVPAYAFTDQYFLIGTSTVPSSTVPSDVSPPAARPENPKNRSRLDRGAAALIPEIAAARQRHPMYFDTRAEPAGFNPRLQERVAEVHLRVHRRQRVLPRRGQHLEERAVPVVARIRVAGRPQVAAAQPRPQRRVVQR